MLTRKEAYAKRTHVSQDELDSMYTEIVKTEKITDATWNELGMNVETYGDKTVITNAGRMTLCVKTPDHTYVKKV